MKIRVTKPAIVAYTCTLVTWTERIGEVIYTVSAYIFVYIINFVFLYQKFKKDII